MIMLALNRFANNTEIQPMKVDLDESGVSSSLFPMLREDEYGTKIKTFRKLGYEYVIFKLSCKIHS